MTSKFAWTGFSFKLVSITVVIRDLLPDLEENHTPGILAKTPVKKAMEITRGKDAVTPDPISDGW